MGSGSLLARLLIEDGRCTEKELSQAENNIRCWSHNDKHPSMSVNLQKGVYFCHGCQISGNTYRYLKDFRGLDNKQIASVMGKAGYTSSQITNQSKNKVVQKKGNVLLKEIPNVITPKKGSKEEYKLTVVHDYKDESGRILYHKARYQDKLIASNGEYPKKTMRFYTPYEKHYFPAKPTTSHVPDAIHIKRDVFYGLYELRKRIDKSAGDKFYNKGQVWIVEGEKCVNAISALDGFAKTKVACIYIDNYGKENSPDFSILKGTMVLIISDADFAGRKKAKELGSFLVNRVHVKQCKYILMEGESAQDVVDVITENNIDSFQKLKSHLASKSKPIEHSDLLKKEAEAGERDVVTVDNRVENILSNNRYYSVLGIVQKFSTAGQKILFRDKKNNLLLEMSVNQLTKPAGLLEIAPITFWQDELGSGDGNKKGNMDGWTCTTRADEILRIGKEKGIIDTSVSMFGIGAVSKNGKYYFNTGKFILAQDKNNLMREVLEFEDVRSNMVFVPGEEVRIKHSKHARKLLKAMVKAIERFRWINTLSAQTFIGWMVSAMIGGALPFRPVIWFVAPPQTGKTWLIEEVVSKFFGSFVKVVGDSSEAGLAALAESNAIPICIDEFDAEDKDRKSRQHKIIELMRMSTSGNAGRTRGKPDGSANVTTPRMSILFASNNIMNLSGASASRMAKVGLSNERKPDWEDISSEIKKSLSDEKALYMRSAIVDFMPSIVSSVEDMNKKLVSEGADSRLAYIQAAITVGYRFASGNDDVVIKPEMPHQKKPEDILEYILSLTPPHASEGILQLARYDSKDLSKLAEQWGIKILRDDEEPQLCINPSLLGHLLREKKLENLESIDLHSYFQSIPGYDCEKKQVRMGGFRKTCFIFDDAFVENLGFSLESLSYTADDSGGYDYEGYSPPDEVYGNHRQ